MKTGKFNCDYCEKLVIRPLKNIKKNKNNFCNLHCFGAFYKNISKNENRIKFVKCKCG